jgi:hypothetical protein
MGAAPRLTRVCKFIQAVIYAETASRRAVMKGLNGNYNMVGNDNSGNLSKKAGHNARRRRPGYRDGR